MGEDEGGTLQGLKAIRAELIDPTIAAHNGRLVKTTGDGLLVEFGSVVDALCCATELQAGVAERNAPMPTDKRMEFRIGINVGGRCGRGWRHLRRRRQYRSSARRLGRARRDLCFGSRAEGCRRQARSRLRGFGRADTQEYCAPAAGVPC